MTLELAFAAAIFALFFTLANLVLINKCAGNVDDAIALYKDLKVELKLLEDQDEAREHEFDDLKECVRSDRRGLVSIRVQIQDSIAFWRAKYEQFRKWETDRIDRKIRDVDNAISAFQRDQQQIANAINAQADSLAILKRESPSWDGKKLKRLNPKGANNEPS